MILSEEYDGNLFLYMYDENGAPIGIHYREDSYAKNEFDCYYFEKNFQGDITGIFNEAGSQVAWYEYDAWGNRVYGTYLSGYSDIFNANPFRYRGYYYDSETGFYYCGSRYYDPVIGRFINPDSTNTLMNTPMAYTDKNLYAYCDNNPVMRVDNGGEFWDTVFDVISLCVSVVDVVKNPDDPWAWVGLAADVVSLAVPFATGGGLIVDAATKADDVVDFAKSVDKTFDVVDTFTDTGKAIDKISEGTKAATNLCQGACFVEGTLIQTPDGSIPIEEIQEGMLVYSYNPETGDMDIKQVIDAFSRVVSELIHIYVGNELITTTPEHPFWVNNIGWIKAEELVEGDALLLLNGDLLCIDKIVYEKLSKTVTVYNFEVEDYHTYYVTNSAILVHNANCKDFVKYDPETIAEYLNTTVEGFHREIKPQILAQAQRELSKGKLNLLGKNPDILIRTKDGMIELASRINKGKNYKLTKSIQDIIKGG